jgi:hypothetical protein
VFTVSPGIPGDSGSAFLDARGHALGVLSTLQLAPLVGSNGVGDLNHELTYAEAHSGIAGLRLAKGPNPSARSLTPRGPAAPRSGRARFLSRAGVRPR